MPTALELGKHLKGAFTVDDIDAYGEEGLVVTISEGGKRKVGGEDGEEKSCIGFKDMARFVVLNKTRQQQLVDLFGAGAELIGKDLRLTTAEVKVMGRNHNMIIFTAP